MFLTSEKKAERRRIFKYLATELPKADSKLVPIPLEIFNNLDRDPRSIYKVSNMDKVPFGRKLLEICPNTQFYGSNMSIFKGNGRIRKFALMTFEDGKRYVVFQQSVEYTNIISILDLQNKTRTKVRSMDKLKVLFKIHKASIQELPLLINHEWVGKYPEFKKALNNRLNNG